MFQPSASRIAKKGNRAPVVKGAGRMKFGGPTVGSFQAPFAKRMRKASSPLRLPARNAGHWLHSAGFCSYWVGPAYTICLGKFFALHVQVCSWAVRRRKTCAGLCPKQVLEGFREDPQLLWHILLCGACMKEDLHDLPSSENAYLDPKSM